MKTDTFDEIIDLEEFAIEGKKPPAVRIDTIDKLATALKIKPSSLVE